MAAASGYVALAGLSLASAYAQSEAQQAQSRYQSQMMEMNARLGEMQGQDAIERGEKDAHRVRARTQKTIGAQRAAMAAQGIDVDSGSAADLYAETREAGAFDELTTRNNAWREAWGYRVGAQNQRNESRLGRMAADNQSRNTLFTGIVNAGDYGLRAYSKRGG